MTTTTMSIQREKLYIRPVEATDQAALEALVAEIWDGQDYLPRVFTDWLNDKNGNFDVMIYENKVIGVAKLTRFNAEEWWLEGLRIDPRYQGQGLARILHHYKVNQARQLGDGVLRFSTSAENEAIHKLAAETGFATVSEFHYMNIPSAEHSTDGLKRLSSDDAQAVQTWLAQSDYFAKVDRSFENMWKWQFATPDLLNTLLSNQQVYGWYGSENSATLQGLVVFDQVRGNAEDTTLYLAYADAKDGASLWPAVQGLAYARDAHHIAYKVFNAPAYVDPIVACGGVWKELNVSLFSRPLSMTVHSDIENVTAPSLN